NSYAPSCPMSCPAVWSASATSDCSPTASVEPLSSAAGFCLPPLRRRPHRHYRNRGAHHAQASCLSWSGYLALNSTSACTNLYKRRFPMPIPPDHCNPISLLFTSDIRLSTEPRTCAHEKTFAPCIFRPPTAPKAEIMGITALTIPKQLPS